MPKLGRAFNHLDDLPLLFGVEGIEDALLHLRQFKSKDGYTSIRTKWDGRIQLYWGRCGEGKFHMAPHHVWERKEDCSSKDLMREAMLNSRGGTREEIQWLIDRLESLYESIQAITPENFRGFVYGDVISLDSPAVQNGIASFKGNVRSETVYHTLVNSEIGKKIQKSKCVIAAHGMFDEWGSKDKQQIPIDDFSHFNPHSDIVILNPEYNKRPIKVNDGVIEQVEGLLDRHNKIIHKFMEPVHGMTDLPDLMYRYVNHKCRYKRQYEINSRDFLQWLRGNNRLTSSKIMRICKHIMEHPSALEIILTICNEIRKEKDKVIEQLERSTGDVWSTHGEGYVRYATSMHTCGNIKLVPRWRWIPN